MGALFGGVVVFLIYTYGMGEQQEEPVPPTPEPTPVTAPMPPAQPVKTATPAPTPVQEEEEADDLRPHGRPEVTQVRYMETAEQPPEGYFAVRFDLPVVVVGEPLLRVHRHLSPPETLPMATRGFPTRELRFGPLSSGYFVAHRLTMEYGTTIRGTDGLDAVIEFEPTGGVPSSTPGVGDLADSALAGCAYWIQNQESIPAAPDIITAVKFATVTPGDDGEMVKWAERIRQGTNFPMLEIVTIRGAGACRDLYSEPVGEANYHKRNWAYRSQCVNPTPVSGLRNPGGVRDISTLVELSYEELDALERTLLRQVADSPACRRFYPQMFFDRWVPVVNDVYYRWE